MKFEKKITKEQFEKALAITEEQFGKEVTDRLAKGESVPHYDAYIGMLRKRIEKAKGIEPPDLMDVFDAAKQYIVNEAGDPEDENKVPQIIKDQITIMRAAIAEFELDEKTEKYEDLMAVPHGVIIDELLNLRMFLPDNEQLELFNAREKCLRIINRKLNLSVDDCSCCIKDTKKKIKVT